MRCRWPSTFAERLGAVLFLNVGSFISAAVNLAGPMGLILSKREFLENIVSPEEVSAASRAIRYTVKDRNLKLFFSNMGNNSFGVCSGDLPRSC